MQFNVQFSDAVEKILFSSGDNPPFDLFAGIIELLSWYETENKVDLGYKKYNFREMQNHWQEIRNKIIGVTMFDKRYQLGDTWKCECGKEHKLDGGYLAALWDIELVHNCTCGRKHAVQSGLIQLIEDQLTGKKKS